MHSPSFEPDKTDEERSADGGGPAGGSEITQPEKKSLWGKAKETLGGVSAHASRVATAGTVAATKSAELGKRTLDAAADVAHGVVDASKSAYSDSKLESAVNFLDGELDQRGVKKAVKETSGAVVGKLDQVTGKRLVELLEAKLKMQDAYNDVLATRLAEALERIERLEARFNEHP